MSTAATVVGREGRASGRLAKVVTTGRVQAIVEAVDIALASCELKRKKGVHGHRVTVLKSSIADLSAGRVK
jgi:hypothetical protein